MGYDFETMVHDFKIFVRFFTFFDVSSISIDCPARCNFEVHIKRKCPPVLYQSCFIIMEDGARVRLQYALAMAFVDHHVRAVNIYQFVRTRYRWKRGQRRRGYWTRPWILRRRLFGLYDQLLVELRNEDRAAFKKFMRMPTEMYDEILARVEHRIQKQYTWFREPLPPGLKLSSTLRHLASGAKYKDMQFAWRVPDNTLSIVVREIC